MTLIFCTVLSWIIFKAQIARGSWAKQDANKPSPILDLLINTTLEKMAYYRYSIASQPPTIIMSLIEGASHPSAPCKFLDQPLA